MTAESVAPDFFLANNSNDFDLPLSFLEDSESSPLSDLSECSSPPRSSITDFDTCEDAAEERRRRLAHKRDLARENRKRKKIVFWSCSRRSWLCSRSWSVNASALSPWFPQHHCVLLSARLQSPSLESRIPRPRCVRTWKILWRKSKKIICNSTKFNRAFYPVSPFDLCNGC